MDQNIIYRVREFNRFYTVALGMLNRKFIDSGYSVAENRILFELSANDGCSANFLVEKLQIDKSYLSRILKSFEAKGLLTKQTSPEDGRAFHLHLTGLGRSETARLIEDANRQIEALVAHLSGEECARLGQAMDIITEYLSNHTQEEHHHGA